MRILWHSAAPFLKTGFGVQSRHFITRLQDLGHEIFVVPTNTEYAGMSWQGIPIFPGGTDRYGVEGVLEWARRMQPDLALSLYSNWALKEDLGSILKAYGIPWAAYTPVDQDPLMPRLEAVLMHAEYPIAMSPFGKRVMEDAGLEPAFVPHGVDTRTFKPMAADKRIVGADENKFVVGTVATNIGPIDRKGWPQMMEAFGRFHEKHPDSVFYAHVDVSSRHQGFDLSELAREHNFRLHNPDVWQLWAQVADEKLAEIYNAFDVFMLLTKGEGFGIPLMEAQACGKPVIVTDYSAPEDLVGSGWKIPVARKQWTHGSSYYGVADVDAAVEALEEAYQLWKDKKLEKKYRVDAQKFARKYDFDRIVDDYFVPFLEEVEDAAEKRQQRAADVGIRQAADNGRGGLERVHRDPDGEEQRSPA